MSLPEKYMGSFAVASMAHTRPGFSTGSALDASKPNSASSAAIRSVPTNPGMSPMTAMLYGRSSFARSAGSSFTSSASGPNARASRAVASRLPGSGVVSDFFTVEECSRCSAPVTVRAATTTWKPRRASSSAHARPMPRLAPVTNATRRSAMPRFLAPPRARGQTRSAGAARATPEPRAERAARSKHWSGAGYARAAGGARSAEQPLGDVHQLELDAIGVGEEDGVVARHVLGVLARRMEDRPSPRRDVARERVHLRAALRPEGHLAEADTVLRERVARIARVRLLDPDAPAGAQPADDRGALGLPDPGIAETRHERRVEGAGPVQIVDGQEHMVHPAGPGDRRGGGWATAAGRCLARRRRPLPSGPCGAQSRGCWSRSDAV